ncbi:MAG TPA: hypothetical protein VMK16_11465, partial [Acidimicrobiales bacterium]|nr:hypothetical protein [Acidimicrobiales bacterium]
AATGPAGAPAAAPPTPPPPSLTPPPYVPPSQPAVSAAADEPKKRKRTGLLVGAGVAAIALVAAGVAVFARGGSDNGAEGAATSDSSVTTDTRGADTTTATGGDISDPLESGLLSSLDLENVVGTLALQGTANFPADVLCDAPGDLLDVFKTTDYRSRLFADSPDFSGKKAAAGAIQFPDSDSADAFLQKLNDFGASHVPSDSCPLSQTDFFDGSVAFTEGTADVSNQGAIGFAKVGDDVVVFVGFGDPTGMDPSEVQFLVQEQKQKMEEAITGESSPSDSAPGSSSTLQQQQAALIAPDTLGEGFEQSITSIDPELDYLCFSTPSADRSTATEVDEKLTSADGSSEVAIVTLVFPDTATASTYVTTTRDFLTQNARSGCNLTPQPADAVKSSGGLDDAFTFTFDGSNGRSQATWGQSGNVAVVVIGNPLTVGSVDDLVTQQMGNLSDAGLVTG